MLNLINIYQELMKICLKKNMKEMSEKCQELEAKFNGLLQYFKKNSIEVQIKEKKPKCLTEDTTDCIHVGFVLALPEVRKMLKNG